MIAADRHGVHYGRLKRSPGDKFAGKTVRGNARELIQKRGLPSAPAATATADVAAPEPSIAELVKELVCSPAFQVSTASLAALQ
jgi:hypothetical protein